MIFLKGVVYYCGIGFSLCERFLNFMSFIYSDQQIAVRDAVLSGISCKVEAYAGTGKTATAVFSAASHKGTGFYFAFNRSASEDAVPRFAVDAPHVRVSTIHAYAMRAIGYKYKDRLQQEPWKLRKAIKDRFSSRLHKVALTTASEDLMIYAILDVLRNFSQSGATSIGLIHIPDIYLHIGSESKLIEEVLAVAREVWKDISSVNGTFPVSHDDYLKIFQLKGYKIKADIIYLDEGQDANGVALSILDAQKNTQKVILGDENQSIYSWRGSVNAMKYFDFPTFPLTTSWRFGPQIAEIANLVLKAKQSRWPLLGAGPEGKVLLSSDRPPTAILCRSNAGIVHSAIEQLDLGRKISVAGGTDRLISMIDGVYNLWSGKRSDHPSLRLFATWEDLENSAKSRQGGSYRPFVKLINHYQFSIPEIVARLKSSIVSFEESDLVIATVHSFKGQETPVVQTGSDFPEFAHQGPTAERPDQIWGLAEEEANLAYVLLTRAQEEEQIGSYYKHFCSSLEIMADLLKSKSEPNDSDVKQPIKKDSLKNPTLAVK